MIRSDVWYCCSATWGYRDKKISWYIECPDDILTFTLPLLIIRDEDLLLPATYFAILQLLLSRPLEEQA
jgi:hypothetical protein